MPSTITPVWGSGREGLWSYGDTVNIPNTYAFVEPGDHYVTRQIKLQCDPGYEVKSKGSGYSKVMGYWAPKHILEAIFVERDRSAAARELQRRKGEASRSRREARERDNALVHLLAKYPGMPLMDAQIIIDRAFEVGSGRVGRSGQIDLDDKLRLATIAHVRHNHTEYDDLVGEFGRDEAREYVAGKLMRIVRGWEDAPDVVLEAVARNIAEEASV